MSSTLKVQPKTKIFLETGSAFDTTDIAKIKVFINDEVFQSLFKIVIKIQTRAGGHSNVPTKAIDISAFSLSKRTGKVEPTDYVKKGTGNGGMMIPKPISPQSHSEIAREMSLSRQPKLQTHAAFCPRPNPPNTELRRYVFVFKMYIYFH